MKTDISITLSRGNGMPGAPLKRVNVNRGRGINCSSSPGTFGKRCAFQSSFATSIRSLRLETAAANATEVLIASAYGLLHRRVYSSAFFLTGAFQRISIPFVFF